jgi:hypothetical protein
MAKRESGSVHPNGVKHYFTMRRSSMAKRESGSVRPNGVKPIINFLRFSTKFVFFRAYLAILS